MKQEQAMLLYERPEKVQINQNLEFDFSFGFPCRFTCTCYLVRFGHLTQLGHGLENITAWLKKQRAEIGVRGG